jgi:hypothetical protein
MLIFCNGVIKEMEWNKYYLLIPVLLAVGVVLYFVLKPKRKYILMNGKDPQGQVVFSGDRVELESGSKATWSLSTGGEFSELAVNEGQRVTWTVPNRLHHKCRLKADKLISGEFTVNARVSLGPLASVVGDVAEIPYVNTFDTRDFKLYYSGDGIQYTQWTQYLVQTTITMTLTSAIPERFYVKWLAELSADHLGPLQAVVGPIVRYGSEAFGLRGLVIYNSPTFAAQSRVAEELESFYSQQKLHIQLNMETSVAADNIRWYYKIFDTSADTTEYDLEAGHLISNKWQVTLPDIRQYTTEQKIRLFARQKESTNTVSSKTMSLTTTLKVENVIRKDNLVSCTIRLSYSNPQFYYKSYFTGAVTTSVTSDARHTLTNGTYLVTGTIDPTCNYFTVTLSNVLESIRFQ